MDHTIALIQKSHDGDEEARARLVEENAGLVWCIVKRFYNRGVEAEDLFQVGNIGLLKAIDKFDMSYDVKFSTCRPDDIWGDQALSERRRDDQGQPFAERTGIQGISVPGKAAGAMGQRSYDY